MKKILSSRFFNRPTLKISQELIGKFLVRKIGKKKIEGMITEVEAYDGHRDRASHASRGETPRNSVMFGGAGVWYIYLIYGNYLMLNIVTHRKGYPAAILIRSTGVSKGPGRLTRHFKIDKSLNKKIANEKSGLWIEDRGVKIAKSKIKRTPRIGVDYAGPIWSKKHWRFVLKTK
jgi:DNA-3-methyladenine glycosylase